MLSRLLSRKFSLDCLLIHPVVTSGKPSLYDIKRAEEGVGLVKALSYGCHPLRESSLLFDSSKPVDEEFKKNMGLIELRDARRGEKVKGFFPIQGINRGGGYIQLSFSTTESEDEMDEWTDEVWRSELACNSILKMRQIHTTRFFGSGKIEEIKERIQKLKPELVFINHLKMNNIQKKNLSKEWVLDDGSHVKILDRFEIILQIFAARAKSNLAKYELGLAYLNHAKSLVGREGGIPVHYISNLRKLNVLSLDEKTANVSARQGAGRGNVGGEGEKEQALLMDQVKSLEVKLKLLVEKERAKRDSKYSDYEENRFYRTEPRIALIGYTNVGKSAMMNELTGKENVESHNRLFETLKTTARNFEIAKNLRGVLIDTIGFIDQLPTELVDSFGSTLKEIETADVVILMEDISHPMVESQREVAEDLVRKIGLGDLLQKDKLVRVWNKTDCVKPERIKRLLEAEPDSSDIVLTSVRQSEGIENLLSKIEEKLNKLMKREVRVLRYPFSEQEVRAQYLREHAGVNELGDFSLIESKNNSQDDQIEVRVPMAENHYTMYLHHFAKVRNDKYESDEEDEDEPSKKKIRKRDMMPEGWLDQK